MRTAVVLGFLAVLVHLGTQSREQATTFATDYRNPYVYGQPGSGPVKLGDYALALADLHPRGRDVPIQVISKHAWPLPWYLRGLNQVGYHETMPDPGQLEVPIVIVDADILTAHTGEPAVMSLANRQASRYGLHRPVHVVMFVDPMLAKSFRDQAAAR